MHLPSSHQLLDYCVESSCLASMWFAISVDRWSYVMPAKTGTDNYRRLLIHGCWACTLPLTEGEVFHRETRLIPPSATSCLLSCFYRLWWFAVLDPFSVDDEEGLYKVPAVCSRYLLDTFTSRMGRLRFVCSCHYHGELNSFQLAFLMTKMKSPRKCWQSFNLHAFSLSTSEKRVRILTE